MASDGDAQRRKRYDVGFSQPATGSDARSCCLYRPLTITANEAAVVSAFQLALEPLRFKEGVRAARSLGVYLRSERY